MKNRWNKILTASLVMLLILYFTMEVMSFSSGVAGKTMPVSGGCYFCHGSYDGTNVTFISGDTIVAPGSKHTYTIRVANQNNNLVKAGINIAVHFSQWFQSNVGTLDCESGSGLKKYENELTHSSPKSFDQKQADFTFSWTAPDSAGKCYMRAVGIAVNGDGSESNDAFKFMEMREIIVGGLELTSLQDSNMTFCSGDAVVFNWTYFGSEKIKIELSTNGGDTWDKNIADNISASLGTYTWTVPSNFQQGDRIKFRISDKDISGMKSVTKYNIRIGGNFSIAKHPESHDICPLSDDTLKVKMNGSALNFQWLKDGNPITGATDSVYIIKAASENNSGSYTVQISSKCGSSISSNPCVIKLLEKTQITNQPVSLSVCDGKKADFEVFALGAGLTYKWYFNNVLIQGAVSNKYTVNSANSSYAGLYYCEVSSLCGTLKSATVKLDINKPPHIIFQPENVTACEGGNASLFVETDGSQNDFEWYFNEKKLNVESNKFLNFDNVKLSDSGNYYVILKNSCGAPLKSNTVKLTVNPKPVIKLQPKSKIVMMGDKVSFEISAANGTLTNQWRKNGNDIPSAINSKFTIQSVTKEDEGKYDCLVTNSCGNTATDIAILTVDDQVEGPGFRLLSNEINTGDIFSDYQLDTVLTDFITNNGKESLIISGIEINGTNPEAFLVILENMTIAPGKSEPLHIKFSPGTPGNKSALISFNSNNKEGTKTVNITGNGSKWKVFSMPPEFDFGISKLNSVNSVPFTIINESDKKVTMTYADFDCEKNSVFKLESPQLPAVIEPNNKIDIKVFYTPNKIENNDCILQLKYYGTNNINNIQLKGSGNIVSVDENKNFTETIIFPNPAYDNIFINPSFLKDNIESHEIEIYNIFGEMLYKSPLIFNNDEIKIDVSGFAPGIYFLRTGNKLEKFIKL